MRRRSPAPPSIHDERPLDHALERAVLETKTGALARRDHDAPEANIAHDEAIVLLRRLRGTGAFVIFKDELRRARATRGTWAHNDVWTLCAALDDLAAARGRRARGTALAGQWRAWRVLHVYGKQDTARAARLEGCSPQIIRKIRRLARETIS